jgi:hypothetical protein
MGYVPDRRTWTGLGCNRTQPVREHVEEGAVRPTDICCPARDSRNQGPGPQERHSVHYADTNESEVAGNDEFIHAIELLFGQRLVSLCLGSDSVRRCPHGSQEARAPRGSRSDLRDLRFTVPPEHPSDTSAASTMASTSSQPATMPKATGGGARGTFLWFERLATVFGCQMRTEKKGSDECASIQVGRKCRLIELDGRVVSHSEITDLLPPIAVFVSWRMQRVTTTVSSPYVMCWPVK